MVLLVVLPDFKEVTSLVSFSTFCSLSRKPPQTGHCTADHGCHSVAPQRMGMALIREIPPSQAGLTSKAGPLGAQQESQCLATHTQGR